MPACRNISVAWHCIVDIMTCSSWHWVFLLARTVRRLALFVSPSNQTLVSNMSWIRRWRFPQRQPSNSSCKQKHSTPRRTSHNINDTMSSDWEPSTSRQWSNNKYKITCLQGKVGWTIVKWYSLKQISSTRKRHKNSQWTINRKEINKSGAGVAPSSTHRLLQIIALWDLQCKRPKNRPWGWRYLNMKQKGRKICSSRGREQMSGGRGRWGGWQIRWGVIKRKCGITYGCWGSEATEDGYWMGISDQMRSWIISYRQLDRIVSSAGSYCIVGWIVLYRLDWIVSGNTGSYALYGYWLGGTYGTDGTDGTDGLDVTLVGRG